MIVLPPFHTLGFWLSSILITMLHVLGIIIPEPLMFCVTLILSVGIPHGALDAVILSSSHSQTAHSIVEVMCMYLMIMALCYTAWYFISPLALAFFLASSAYHFGGDWAHCATTRMLIGSGILSSMYVYHPVETLHWLLLISPAFSLTYLYGVSCVLFALCVCVIAIKLYQGQYAYLECVMLIFISKVLTPIAFFTLYFCTLHSPRHYHSLIKRKYLTLSRVPLLAVFILATYCIGIITYYLFFTAFRFHDAMISNLLVLLLILNIPHNLMGYLFKRP